MTEAEIAEVAESVRRSGVPDCLNVWLDMTPAKWAATEAAVEKMINGKVATMAKMKPGPKEEALKALRADGVNGASSAPHLGPGDGAKPAGKAPATEESEVRDYKPKTKAPRTAVRGKTSAKKPDRSPRTVGEFIVAGGEGGRSMADLEKRFSMDAHPLRSKIHDAKHKLGYKIEYDHEAKRYTARAPRSKAA